MIKLLNKISNFLRKNDRFLNRCTVFILVLFVFFIPPTPVQDIYEVIELTEVTTYEFTFEIVNKSVEIETIIYEKDTIPVRSIEPLFWEHYREIYAHGQMLGNNPNIFSRVGDSITVYVPFMYYFGTGDYNLTGKYDYLEQTIDYFNTPTLDGNSFTSSTIAAVGGWSSEAALNYERTDYELCFDFEAPLECEYRLKKPSIALIMFGTNDVLWDDLEMFEKNMRLIIQFSIDKGVIPVISTIPPFYLTRGTASHEYPYNLVIAKLAREYNIMLWDYWKSLLPLPNSGLFDDGVHPNFGWEYMTTDFREENLQYGMVVRNLEGLQILDQIREKVLN